MTNGPLLESFEPEGCAIAKELFDDFPFMKFSFLMLPAVGNGNGGGEEICSSFESSSNSGCASMTSSSVVTGVGRTGPKCDFMELDRSSIRGA